MRASMQRLLQSRTTFIIAHRLSTIRRADIIVVMQQGEIAEVGDHDSLLRRGGIYASMLERQFQNGEREPESRRAIRRRSGSRADAE